MCRTAVVVYIAIVFAILYAPLPARACTDLGGLDLDRASLADIQAGLSTGKFTSVQLVDAYKNRIAAFDSRLHAIQTLNPRAEKEAAQLDAERRAGRVRGLLHGIPVLVKDNINTKDLPTTGGSVALADNYPRRDALVVRQLRRAGAIVLAKATMGELADMSWGMGPDYPGSSSLGGTVYNPYNGGSPGSSSSGSGVGAAMAFAAAAVGTDTGGSVLSPSLNQMLVGFRPTTGRVSTKGVMPMQPASDTVGPMARSPQDAAALLSVMEGRRVLPLRQRPGGVRGVRIGVRQGLLKEHGVQLRDALSRLQAAGATLVDVGKLRIKTAEQPARAFVRAFNGYLRNETRPSFRVRSLTDLLRRKERIRRTKGGFPSDWLLSETVKVAQTETNDFSSERKALRSRRQARSKLAETLRRHRLDALMVGLREPADGSHPAVTVPVGLAQGTIDERGTKGQLPVGLLLAGRRSSDRQLLELAAAVDAVLVGRRTPFEINSTLQKVCL